MKDGVILIYYGTGKGKTSVAIGRGMRALGDGQQVVMIQFMDYHNSNEIELLRKLEPDFRIFHFEKQRETEQLTDEIRREMAPEIRNAFNFTKKIMETGECEMLMLDGVLECVREGFISDQELVELLEKKPSYMSVLLTGDSLPELVGSCADYIYQIKIEKFGKE